MFEPCYYDKNALGLRQGDPFLLYEPDPMSCQIRAAEKIIKMILHDREDRDG